MTKDERERIMNIIVKRQKRITAQQEQARELLGELARCGDDDKEQRIAGVERAETAIANLLAQQDRQLVAVTENINNLTAAVAALTTTVERYISARGNNGTGAV